MKNLGTPSKLGLFSLLNCSRIQKGLTFWLSFVQIPSSDPCDMTTTMQIPVVSFSRLAAKFSILFSISVIVKSSQESTYWKVVLLKLVSLLYTQKVASQDVNFHDRFQCLNGHIEFSKYFVLMCG